MTDGPHCSKCDAPIKWFSTVNGKPQPVDREPNPDGNLIVTGNYRHVERMGALEEIRVVTKAERESMFPPEGDRWMPHHATCPNVADFRKPKAS